jgi:predicted RNA methylase
MNNAIGVSLWDRAAANMKHWLSNDGYLPQFMEKVKIQPSWTVLDVGCGPGHIVIWAAKRSKRVTALDSSCKMLNLVKESMQLEALNNITCLQRSWDDESLDDLEEHDVVIASRSLGTMQNQNQALDRINRYSGRCAYVTCGIKVETPLTQQINLVTGKEPNQVKRDTLIYSQLKKMGIKPEIEYIDGRSKFYDINDALEHYSWADGALTSPQKAHLKQLLSENLVSNSDGSLEYPYNDLRWAVFHWNKK